MKNQQIRDRIQVILACTLIIGFLFGSFTEKSFTVVTTDWSAKGQPLLDRFKDEFIHFIPGAKVGAIVGLILGLVIPMKWIKGDVQLPIAQRRKLSLKHKIITYAILVGIMLIIGNYIHNGTLLVAITIPIVIGGFWIATSLFGFDDDGAE